MHFKSYIHEVNDFPLPGMSYKDISPLLRSNFAFKSALEKFHETLVMNNRRFDIVVGVDSRGFIFGPSLANCLSLGFVMARKEGKTPPPFLKGLIKSDKGVEEICLSNLVLESGMRVHIHDDILATGSTSLAVKELVESVGCTVDSFSFIVEIKNLGGRAKLGNSFITSLIEY